MAKEKIEKLYERHAHLAVVYAKKIWNERNIGMEREDIEQELRLKIWTSINTYIDKWNEYLKTDRMKPVPLPFYLKSALLNKTKDLARKIGEVAPRDFGDESVKGISIIPMSEMQFDYGMDDFPIEVDFKNKRLMVGCTDMLEKMNSEEKKFFMLYFKGFTISKINKIYKGKTNAKTNLKKNLKELREQIPNVVENVNSYTVLQNGQ